MAVSKKRWVLMYGLVYLVIVGCSFGALILNIKTVPLIQDTKGLQQENKRLTEENQRLFFELSQKTSFKATQERAEAMGMLRVPVSEMVHMRLPKHVNMEGAP